MLKILGRATSTNVQKVLWFCDTEGIEYDHDNDIGGAFGRNDTPEYLAMNPNGRVPVVIDDGFVMWESCSILRYLARKTKSAFYPSGFAERQIVECWMDWELSLLAPRHVPVFIGMVRTKPEDRNQSAIDKAMVQWNAAMQILENQLAGPLPVNPRKPMRISATACGYALNRAVTMVCLLVRLCRFCARQAISQRPISGRSAFRAITVSSNCARQV
jgi:glutathione S-transferase